MRAKISQEQLDLLESAEETRELVKPLVTREPVLALEGEAYPISELRSACEDVLIRIGFDKDYNPNFYGKMLEDLIDKLFE